MSPDDLKGFIEANKSITNTKYDKQHAMFVGDHSVLHKAAKDHGPDNKLVANLAHYIVETFNGYFMGIPPKITLDDNKDNQLLQLWNDTNSMQDKLNEISKQSDVYGRSIAFLYQDENSETRVAFSSPDTSFMVYDDTVAHKPLAYVRYAFDEQQQITGTAYFEDVQYEFNSACKPLNEEVNQFKQVPAVEFYGNEERQGVFDNAMTLIDALDSVLSQKANQNEYFDNAYLVLAGMNLDTDGDGEPEFNLDGNQILYSPDADSVNAKADFLQKPDGDTMQEHLTDRLMTLIYQVSMVANLNDDAFSGNSSGVALQYKLLPMKNMAANKERKFTQALRQLYKIAFSVGTILNESKADSWQELTFQFTRNMPVNLADETQTAANLQGVVSKETQLSTLSIVDDPKDEIERMQKEDINTTKAAEKSQDTLPYQFQQQNEKSKVVTDNGDE